MIDSTAPLKQRKQTEKENTVDQYIIFKMILPLLFTLSFNNLMTKNKCFNTNVRVSMPCLFHLFVQFTPNCALPFRHRTYIARTYDRYSHYHAKPCNFLKTTEVLPSFCSWRQVCSFAHIWHSVPSWILNGRNEWGFQQQQQKNLHHVLWQIKMFRTLYGLFRCSFCSCT